MCLSNIRHRNKVFLSDSHEQGGSVTWNVAADKGVDDDGKKKDPITSTLRITDCYRIVYLEFDCSKVKHIQKRIDKVDVLLEEITKFKEALLEAQEFHKPKSLYY